MHLDILTLNHYGGITQQYRKGCIIYQEYDMPHYVYQVIKGEVRLYTQSKDGKTLTLAMFGNGESFGEPSAILNKAYPCTACAEEDSIIAKVTRRQFFSMLTEKRPLVNDLLQRFAERMYHHNSAAQVWVGNTPKERLLIFLKSLRKDDAPGEKCMIRFTRKQIADFTGLRVETVIRTLIELSKCGIVEIRDHKVYF